MKQSCLPPPPPFKLSCAIAATAAQPLHSLAGFLDVGKPFATSDVGRWELGTYGCRREKPEQPKWGHPTTLGQHSRPLFEELLSKSVIAQAALPRKHSCGVHDNLGPRVSRSCKQWTDARQWRPFPRSTRGIISRFLRANNASERGGCLPTCGAYLGRHLCTRHPLTRIMTEAAAIVRRPLSLSLSSIA